MLAAAIVAAGCASGTKVGAPSARDHALLESVLAGMKTDLVSVQIADPTKEWGGPTPARKFLYVTPAASSTTGRIADGWYTTLIAGAYEAQCGRRSADCLLGYSTAGLGGSRMHGTRARLPQRSRRTLAREIRSRFAELGLHVSSIWFQRPYGLAPVVTVSARRPQRAVKAFYTSNPFVRLPIEGFLVRMTDAHGRLFLIDGASSRTNEGAGWLRPGLRAPNEKMVATP